MRFTRVDDDVVVGIGGDALYRKGSTYDVTDPALITQFGADPGWRMEKVTEPPSEPPAGVAFGSDSI